MTDPEITWADREAAAALIEQYWQGHGEDHLDMRRLAQNYREGHAQGVWAWAFARHRMLGMAEGAAQERAEIVAWLRENAPQHSHEQLADAIERGEYKRSE